MADKYRIIDWQTHEAILEWSLKTYEHLWRAMADSGSDSDSDSDCQPMTEGELRQQYSPFLDPPVERRFSDAKR